jgi:hypothetical protein
MLAHPCDDRCRQACGARVNGMQRCSSYPPYNRALCRPAWTQPTSTSPTMPPARVAIRGAFRLGERACLDPPTCNGEPARRSTLAWQPLPFRHLVLRQTADPARHRSGNADKNAAPAWQRRPSQHQQLLRFKASCPLANVNVRHRPTPTMIAAAHGQERWLMFNVERRGEPTGHSTARRRAAERMHWEMNRWAMRQPMPQI